MKNRTLSLLAAGCCMMIPALGFSQVQVVPMVPGEPRGMRDNFTDGYGPSRVDARLNVSIADDVHTVKFVRDNTDPYVVTKAYDIKNANPYAVRGYLLNAVRASSRSGSPVSVDALKFNDGTALLLVSAEEDRFKDSSSGEGIDTIISKLDKKGLTFETNTNKFVYFPKISSAERLRQMLVNVGANVFGDVESNNGIDNLQVDSELNALVVSAPMWSWKNIMEMLQKYDTPAPEVRISYKVYEIYSENDDKFGIDFQSWKNNDGVDLFATGARVRRNWSTLFTGNATNNGTNTMSYWDFNPKWNTRYVDILASSGKAKLLQSGMLVAKNRECSNLIMNYGYFYDGNDVNAEIGDAAINPNVDVIPRQTVTKILPESVLNDLAPDLNVTGTAWRALYNLAGDLSYQVQNYQKGKTIKDDDIAEYITADGQKVANSSVIATFKAAATAYQTAAATYQTAAAAYYADPNNATKKAAYVQAAAALQTAKTSYESASQQAVILEELDRVYDKPNYLTAGATAGVIHGKLQIPMAKNGFRFAMTVSPIVTQNATQICFDFDGISMIGFNSDGTPRMSRSSTTTRIQLSNGPKEFVVDDIQKVEVVRGVAGLPWLKDLPILGWLVGDENESTKKTRVIVMLRAEYVTPKTSMPTAVQENIGKITDKVEAGWKSPVNNMGFQQLLIDTNEWK